MVRTSIILGRLVGVLAVLGLASGVAIATPAAVAPPAVAAQPELTVTPHEGLHHGDTVTVVGQGFQPDEVLSLRMAAGFIGGWAGETALDVRADTDGRFTTEYSVSRVIWARTVSDEFVPVDCAAFAPDDPNQCFLATYGTFSEAWLEFEPTWVSLAVAMSGTVSKAGGTATVVGTVTCPPLAYPRDDGTEHAVVTGTLLQRIGRKSVASGTFRTPEIRCTGNPVRWTAAVLPSGGVPFGQGAAELRATASIVTLGPWSPTEVRVIAVRLTYPKR